MIRICVTTISLALLTSAQAGIDFTPTSGERKLEGIVFQQTLFHQDGRTITYEPPTGWTCSGDPAKMKLVPPNISQAQATMEQATLPAPQVFDEATMKQLQQEVMASLPKGAQNIALVSEERNPLRINQQATYAVTFIYNFYGQDFGLSVLFANLGETQLRCRTVARKSDFEQVHRAFRASLFTLSWQS